MTATPDTRLDDLCRFLRDDLLGSHSLMETPFGRRIITYADFTASGRSLRSIEQYVCDTVLVEYANTHTEDSYTGLRTTARSHEASKWVRRGVNANADDILLFVGTGSTGAIKRFQEIIGVAIPPTCAAEVCVLKATQPLVVVGPYEHHSNEISWRETICEVVECPLDAHGLIDLEALDALLAKVQPGRKIIGSFSAGSNVTGVLSDVHAIARILHRHGAIACFDFAACAPYVPIDMHPADDPEGHLDVVFISPHKMLGGPGTPGVLVFPKKLYTLEKPTTSGGGTVVYVSPLGHVYTDDIEAREDAGTPGIVQKIRAGLVFALKDKIGAPGIQQREHHFLTMALEAFREEPAIELLGPDTPNRLPILSFNIVHSRMPDGRKRYLHHRFVCALLNDLFGIQSRAGCSCAGPYGHRLLGIDPDTSERYRCVIVEGYEGLKPGWVRLGFHFVMTEEEVRFLLDALRFIAHYGDRFRPLYNFDVHTGLWVHRDKPADPPELLHIDEVLTGSITGLPRAADRHAEYAQYLANAEAMLTDLPDDPAFSCCPELPSHLHELVFFTW